MDPSSLAVSAAMSVLEDEDFDDGYERHLPFLPRGQSTGSADQRKCWATDLPPPSLNYASSGTLNFPVASETDRDLGDGAPRPPVPTSYEAMMLRHLQLQQHQSLHPQEPSLRSEPRLGTTPYQHLPAPNLALQPQAFYPPGLAPPGPTLLEQPGQVEELQKQVLEVKHLQQLQELLQVQELQRRWKQQSALSQHDMSPQPFGHHPPYPSQPQPYAMLSKEEDDDEEDYGFHGAYRDPRRFGPRFYADDRASDASNYRLRPNFVKASAQRPSKTTRLKCKAIANRAIDLAMETRSPECIQALRDLSAQSPYMHSLLRHTLGVLTSRESGR